MVLFLFCFNLLGGNTQHTADAAAGINHQINFQGKLVNADGTNVTDGSYSIVFSIYNVASAGSAIWTETQSVTLSNGIFQVMLGSSTALPGSVDFNTDNIYLGIKVGADAEMTPRVRFGAVPQAFNAEKLGGLDKTGFIQNSTSLQSSANLYIQSGATGNVTAKLRAFTGQTADILQVRDSGDTTTVFAISPAGTITAGTWNGTAITDTYVSDTLTIGSAGTVDWQALNNYPAGCSAGNAITALGDTVTCSPVLTAEADTLATVTGRGASTATAVTFSGGATIRGVTVDSATGTNDKIAMSITTVGAASFTGTITNSDLTAARTWTFQDNTGVVALGTAANALFFTTTGATNVTLPTSGTLCSTATCVTSEADTLATVTGRGATTTTASSFTGGATIRGLTVDTATATQDRILVTVAGVGASRFDGTITNGVNDLTAARTWTLPDATGTFITTGNLTGITATGTITSGTWQGTAISAGFGGTGLTSYTVGDLLYASGATTIAKLADVAVGSCLNSGGVGVAPTWGSCGAGISVVGSFSASSQTNGATISGNTITFGPADTTNPGMVTASGSQTFGGNKTFNGSVTVAASQTIRLIGGNTGSRPASPTEGMLYYDTTTHQLLQYNGSSWMSDRTPTTKIIAPNNASQTAKDSADVVLTGTADQTLINTTLSAAAGGKVYILEGTVNITGSISVPNNTTLAGAGRGTVITIANAFNANINFITNTTTGGAGTGVTIQDLQLDGNMANQTAGNMFGVYMDGMGALGATALTGVPGAKISNIWAQDFKGTTFTNSSSQGGSINLTNSFNTTVSNSTLTSTSNKGSTGIYLSGSSSNTFVANTIQGIYTGIYLFNSTNNTFTANTITRAPDYGVNIEGASTANTFASNTFRDSSEHIVVWGTGSSNNVFTSNTFTDTNNYTSTFLETQTANNTITGNSFLFDPLHPQTGVVLSGSNAQYNTVSGNTFQGSFNGIAVWSSASYNTVSGNNIIQTNTGTTASAEGIILSNTHHNLITGNTVTNAGGSNDNNGIYLAANSDSNTITSNTITDSSATTTNYAIYISSSTADTNYLADNTLGNGSIKDLGTGTIYGGQLDTSGNFQIQPAGNVQLFGATSTGNLKVGAAAIQPTIITSVKSTSSGTFGTRADYTSGTNPLGIANGDFNGDGKPDLAVTNFASNTMSVFINNGDGTFATKVDYTTGTGPYGITSADFNGDGKIDLATANNGTTTMSVFISNGNGTFATKVDYTTGTQPRGITSADFNGDGKPDVAVSNYGSATTSIFINSGTGTFATKVDYTTGTNPDGIIAADYNGDGKPDIATANGGSSMTVLLNSGLGTGQFGASPPTATSKVDYTTGTTARGITTGDFNKDGKLDLAVTNNAATSVSVFINSGAGAFAAKVDYTTGAGSAPQYITSADFNADGYADLALNSASAVMSVLKNNGNGTFAAKVDYTTQTSSTAITSADFNDDGFPDIAGTSTVGATGTVMYVFLNTISSGFSSTSSTQVNAKEAIISDSGKVGLLVQGANASDNIFQAQSSSGQILASIDGKGRLTVGGGPVYVSQLMVDGPVVFAAKTDYATATAPTFVVSADFNGDGKPDNAVVNQNSSSISVFINNGNGTFAAKVDYTTGTTPQDIATGDFNGDGKPDLAVTNLGSTSMSVFINNGNGTFAAKVDYTTGGSPQGITAADFNNDGKPDIAVANNSSTTISVFINNGTGTFASKVDYTSGSSVWGLTYADFNGDGYYDLAAANNSASTMSVFINNGNGTFAAKVDYATGTGPRSISSGDINNDSKPDIIVSNYNAGTGTTMSVFINNGNGTFAAKVDYTTGTSPRGISITDINGDTKADVIVANSASTTMSVFINIGNGIFASKIDYTTGSGPLGVSTADFNGDGMPDIAVSNSTSATLSIYFNLSTAFANPTSKGTLSVTTADSSSGGLYIQGVANQTADYLNIQNSSGAELVRVNSSGTVSISNNAIINGTLKVSTTTSAALVNPGYFSGIGTGGSSSSVNLVVNNDYSGTGHKAGLALSTRGVTKWLLANDAGGDSTDDFFIYNSGAGAGTALLISGATRQVSVGVTGQTGTQRLCHNGANSTATQLVALNDCGATQTDFAETYGTDGTLEPGTIVMVDPSKPTITVPDKLNPGKTSTKSWATLADQPNAIIGAISTNPYSEVLGADLYTPSENPRAVGLTGRVPVRVNTHGGTILVGDPITLSDIPGVGTKATSAGRIIGYAMEDYSGTTEALITVLTSPSFWAPSDTNILTATDIHAENLTVTGEVSTNKLIVTGNATIQGNLKVQGDIETRNISVNGHIITAGDAPQVVVGQGAGVADIQNNIAAPVVTIVGNDTSGTITITTGTSTLADKLVQINFATNFGGKPRIVLTPASRESSRINAYYDASNAANNGFSIFADLVPAANTTYSFTYFVVQ